MGNTNNVLLFDEESKKIKQKNAARAEKIKRQRKEGGHAWGRLNRKKKKGEKLSREDRIVLARNIHKEIVRHNYKSRDLVKQGGFFYGAKKLHRLRLPPDVDPGRRDLCAAPSVYIQLIEAIQILSGETIYLLADRLMMGTSLHPINIPESKEAELIIAELQNIIDRIDLDFHLFDKYKKTANLKLEHLRSGGTVSWPILSYLRDAEDYERRDPVLADLRLSKKVLRGYGFKNDEDRFIKLCDLKQSVFNTDDQRTINEFLRAREEWKKERAAVCDAQNVYWRKYWDYEPESQADLDMDAIPFLPHFHLGPIIDRADLPSGYKNNDAKAEFYLERAREHHRKFLDNPMPVVWDDNDEAPSLIKDPDPTIYTAAHAWLFLYPNRENTGLIPIFAQDWEEGGFMGDPMDLRWLHYSLDLEHVAGGNVSLYDHIKDIIVSNLLEEEWRRTAPFLDFNPFLKQERDKQEFRARLKERLNKRV